MHGARRGPKRSIGCASALDDIEITGVTTNRALLTSVLADEEFRRGGVATNFLAARRAHLSFGDPQAGDVDAALAAVWCATREASPDALWADSRGWRLAADRHEHMEVRATAPWRRNSARRTTYVGTLAGREHTLRVVAREANVLQAELAGQMQRVRVIEVEADVCICSGQGGM